MSAAVILVENLSKQYRLGSRQRAFGSLRESVMDTLTTPVKAILHPQQRRKPPEMIWALKDVSFEVQPGEVVGVIGRNGAGKSTLLKILARITKPTSGRAVVRGRVGSLLEVGTGFHPELTGRDNIYLNGAILGMRRAEIAHKFDAIVAFSEIEQFLDTPVKRYSAGMYVRLAFAVAAHLDTEILFVDEVLAVGDAAFQKKCLGKMENVANEGRTIIFVSHQMAMINTLCDRAMLLSEGELVKSGRTEAIIEDYLVQSDVHLSQDLSAHRIFTEDPSKAAQILEVSIVNEKLEPAPVFDVLDDKLIQIEYIIRKPLIGLSVIVQLKKNGETIFISFETDANPRLLEKREIGRYTTGLKLPNVLKKGSYTLDFAISRLNISSIDFQPEAIKFTIEENNFDTSMRSYSSRRRGFIGAHIEWETKMAG